MAYISETAEVDGSSNLGETVRVEDYAQVEMSSLSDKASLYDSASVRISALHGAVTLSENCKISDSKLGGSVKVYGNAYLDGVDADGKCCFFGNARLVNILETKVALLGSCKFGGSATFEGLNTPEHFVEKYGADKVIVEEGYGVILTDVWDMG